MKIIIPGGSGQVGTVLARAFHADGHEVVVLSRQLKPAPWRVVAWDAKSPAEWNREVDGADVVINLAGRNVNCRYGQKNRRAIMDSRIASTRAVGRAIQQAKQPPRLWLQASTATIYSHRFDAANDEATGILGGDEPGAPDTWNFSIDVAKSWEAAASGFTLPRTRLVLMRSAITMNADPGSAFSVLLRLVRLGLGGINGTGQQYVSWIHEQDFVRAIAWLIEHEELFGPVNIAAPNPLPNAEFMKAFRRAWGQPVGLPATDWMLELGALMLRTETELILKSRRVIPTRLLESGFTFDFPTWPETVQDLCNRWRNQDRKPASARSI